VNFSIKPWTKPTKSSDIRFTFILYNSKIFFINVFDYKEDADDKDIIATIDVKSIPKFLEDLFYYGERFDIGIHKDGVSDWFFKRQMLAITRNPTKEIIIGIG